MRPALPECYVSAQPLGSVSSLSTPIWVYRQTVENPWPMVTGSCAVRRIDCDRGGSFKQVYPEFRSDGSSEPAAAKQHRASEGSSRRRKQCVFPPFVRCCCLRL